MIDQFLYVINAMKKATYCATIFCIVGSIISSLVSYAANIDSRLDKIYSTIIPIEIRRNFDKYVDQYQDCPECKRFVIDGDKFIDIYSSKFMVIDLKGNDFGGIWVTILVANNQQQIFKLWLYDIEEDIYELRSISELSSFLDNGFIKELFGEKYNHFWL